MFFINTFNFKLYWNLQRVLDFKNLAFILNCYFSIIFNCVICLYWYSICYIFYLNINIWRNLIIKHFIILWYKLIYWSLYLIFNLSNNSSFYQNVFVFFSIFYEIQKYFLVLYRNTFQIAFLFWVNWKSISFIIFFRYNLIILINFCKVFICRNCLNYHIWLFNFTSSFVIFIL